MMLLQGLAITVMKRRSLPSYSTGRAYGAVEALEQSGLMRPLQARLVTELSSAIAAKSHPFRRSTSSIVVSFLKTFESGCRRLDSTHKAAAIMFNTKGEPFKAEEDAMSILSPRMCPSSSSPVVADVRNDAVKCFSINQRS